MNPTTTDAPTTTTAKPLNGVKGWLLFFVIFFGLMILWHGATLLWRFNRSDGSIDPATLISSLVVVALLIVAMVAICLQRKLGRWVAIAAAGVAAVSSLAKVAVALMIFYGSVPLFGLFAFSGERGPMSALEVILPSVVVFAGSIALMMILLPAIITLIGTGLTMVYFIASRRVKETLIK